MTNRELNILDQNLSKIGNLQGVKFVYAIAKNAQKIKNELQVVRETINKFEGIEEYRDELKKLKEDFMLKMRTIKDEREIAEEERKIQEIMNKKYPKISKMIEELWNQESKIELHKIKQKDLPKEITADQLSGIIDLIED